MLGVEVLPMQHTLVMEDPVTEIANVLPIGAEICDITFAFRRMRKCVFGDVMGNPGCHMWSRKEANPEAKGELSDHAVR